jgi:hypothetical protein
MASRALANEESPTRDRLRSVWNRVAFTNYISDTVGDGAGTRPTPAMWEAAKQEFLPQLSKLHPNPKRLIVLGKDMWNAMPDTEIHITDDVQGYRLGDHVIICCALFHPARGLARTLLFAHSVTFPPARQI